MRDDLSLLKVQPEDAGAQLTALLLSSRAGVLTIRLKEILQKMLGSCARHSGCRSNRVFIQ
jgi:hypothetical protein